MTCARVGCGSELHGRQQRWCSTMCRRRGQWQRCAHNRIAVCISVDAYARVCTAADRMGVSMARIIELEVERAIDDVERAASSTQAQLELFLGQVRELV